MKVGTRNNLLRHLTSTEWGANPNVLRTTGMALCFSAGEYACPIWHRSAHAGLVDAALNETCRIITGCLKPTSLNVVYPLAGIAPPGVRRNVACCIEKLKQKSDNRHPLHGHQYPPARLKSRKSFLRSTPSINDHPAIARYKLWKERFPPPSNFIKPKEQLPPGHDLPWPKWVSLNRLRSGVGRCRLNLCKWGFRDPSHTACDCGEPAQTMSHLLVCPLCPNTCTESDLNAATHNARQVATYYAGKI